MTTETMHLGRKISRIRELKGMKQETLASVMGVSQQAISKLEQSEQVDDDRLEEVSKALGVSTEAIKNFNEETALSIISNTFNIEKDAYIGNSQPTFNINPIEEIKKLHEEKIALYERMLKEKDEMMERLEKQMEKK